MVERVDRICLSVNVATSYVCRTLTNALFSTFCFFFQFPFFCSSFLFLGMKQIMSSNAVHVQVMNNCERTNVADDEGETKEQKYHLLGLFHSLKYCHCSKLYPVKPYESQACEIERIVGVQWKVCS